MNFLVDLFFSCYNAGRSNAVFNFLRSFHEVFKKAETDRLQIPPCMGTFIRIHIHAMVYVSRKASERPLFYNTLVAG